VVTDAHPTLKAAMMDQGEPPGAGGASEGAVRKRAVRKLARSLINSKERGLAISEEFRCDV
jgi:hypothetical protein